jgi:hypothetical protein
MNKVIRPCKVDTGRGGSSKYADVFIHIQYKDNHLSITGVVGPNHHGNAWGSAGQIVMDFRKSYPDVIYCDGWTSDLFDKLLAIWDRYHLNDMQAGSPNQMAWLREHESSFPRYPISHYTWAREQLAAVGLQPDPDYIYHDKPYSYGCAWLLEEVPADVIAWLEELPESFKTPAWI